MIGHLKRRSSLLPPRRLILHQNRFQMPRFSFVPKLPCTLRSFSFSSSYLFSESILFRDMRRRQGFLAADRRGHGRRVAGRGPPRDARAFPRPRCRHTWDASDRRARNAGARRISGRRGGGRAWPQLWGTTSRSLRPKWRADRAALTAGAASH